MSKINLEPKWIDEVTKIDPSLWSTGLIGGSSGKRPPLTVSSKSTRVEPREVIVGDLVQEGYWVKATGSRVTKSGFTSESDWDYVVYDPDNHLVNKLLADSNWSKDGSGNGDPGIDFHSFKNGMTNLILVSTEDIWKKYIIATNLIKSLDCKTKGERIAIFDSVFERDKNLRAVDFEDCPF